MITIYSLSARKRKKGLKKPMHNFEKNTAFAVKKITTDAQINIIR